MKIKNIIGVPRKQRFSWEELEIGEAIKTQSTVYIKSGSTHCWFDLSTARILVAPWVEGEFFNGTVEVEL